MPDVQPEIPANIMADIEYSREHPELNVPRRPRPDTQSEATEIPIDVVSVDDIFECEDCGDSFDTEDELDNHDCPDEYEEDDYYEDEEDEEDEENV